MIVDDGGQVQCDIVLCHAHLARDLNDLDLDIDLNEALGERIDLDETRVDGTRKATEFGDETNVTLRDRLVGIGADDAAGNGSAETNALTEIVD